MIGDNVHGMCLIVVAIGKGISTYWWNANNWDNQLEMGIVLMVTQQ